MRNVVFLFLLLPQIILAQYKADCFSMDEKGTDVPMRLTIQKDTTINLENIGSVYGFFVTGSAELTDKKSYIRIILKDDYNYEHLVYENNYLLADSIDNSFDRVALETKLLDERIVPKSMRIEVCNATLSLNSISYTNSNHSKKNSEQIRSEQNDYIIEKTNIALHKNRIPWQAGKTCISELSFEEKKGMFKGHVPQLYGFDLYIGGIFVSPSVLDDHEKNINNYEPNTYVNEWDWRNRHGKNWMTPVKNQGPSCGTCWAFAGIGILESYLNLYYNRIFVNNDWSEQEIISCNGAYNNQMGEPGAVLSYVMANGVVPEGCFPYNGCNSYVDSLNPCESPDSILHITNFNYITNTGENSIKQKVIKSPITIGLHSIDHVMVLCGYKELEEGDSFYLPNSISTNFVIDNSNYQQYIGDNVWLVKNSWGEEWGDNGYGYIDTEIYDIFLLCSVADTIYCTTLSYNDIVCEDADGDGYFYWGIGTKPSSCPDWAPNNPDGDDSNANIGPLDEFGNPTIINPSGSGVTIINSPQTITEDQEYNYDVFVYPNVTWTIKSDLLFHYGAHIYLLPGATVNIDGGRVISARIIQGPGSYLNMMNEGIIIPPTNEGFTVPTGANMNITKGVII